VEQLKATSLGYAPALPAIIRLGWKGLSGTNTGLLRKFVNYGQVMFNTHATAFGARETHA